MRFDAEIFGNGIGDMECIFLSGFKYHDKHGGDAVNNGIDRVFRKTVPNGCQPTKFNLLTTGTGQHNNVGKLLTGILAAHGTHPDLLSPGTDGAAMQIDTGFAYCLSHLIKGDTIPA